MPYRVVKPNGEIVTVPVRVKPALDHKTIYAHGAQGGALANYHYRIDFYQDMVPPTDYVESSGDIQQEGLGGAIERRIVASVFIPLPFAKELRDWLDKNLNEVEKVFGEIKLPSDIEADEPKVKKA